MNIEKQTFTKSEKIWAGVLLIIYFFLPNPIKYIISDKEIASFIYLIILLIISIIIFFKKELMNFFRNFKKNYKQYPGILFQNQCIIYGLYFLASFISVLILNDNNTTVNQQSIESLPLWYLVILSLVIAPIFEELLFRASIRRFLKNDTVFIIVSGCIFGFLHTLAESSLLAFFIKGIPYVTMGCALSYLYVKSNNISSSMFAHFFHNLIGVAIIIFL